MLFYMCGQRHIFFHVDFSKKKKKEKKEKQQHILAINQDKILPTHLHLPSTCLTIDSLEGCDVTEENMSHCICLF